MPNGLMQKENPLHAEVVEDGAARGHEKRLDRYSTAKARQKQLTDFIIKQNHGSDNPSYQKELRALVEAARPDTVTTDEPIQWHDWTADPLATGAFTDPRA